MKHRFGRISLAGRLLVVALSLAACAEVAAEGPTWAFRIQIRPEVHQSSFSGRVYVFFSRNRVEPRTGGNWRSPEPVIALDVENWEPGAPVELRLDDPDLLIYPQNLSPEMLRGLIAQPVVRFNPWEREVGAGPGNGTGPGVRPSREGAYPLVVDRLIPQRPFPTTHWTKLLEVPSPKLSAFSQRDVVVKASVTLPGSYFSQPERRYPVLFEVPGFGGRHDSPPFIHQSPVRELNFQGVEFIRVVLDPNCPLGHHVFANSANNGPWGDALVEEFLPALDRQYRTISSSHARLLTGHSSGGWSVLWLQMTYPEHFGGAWSTAPDSPDFRDFQRINVYEDANFFVDAKGQRRPLAREHGRVLRWVDEFSRMEEVLGHGEQLLSFEAVFGPRGEDGLPAQIWDRRTGAIDPVVAEAWKQYDIQRLLVERWPVLRDQLAGKLYIYMGTEDTFFLEGGTRLLKQTLEELGSDAHVELLQGRDHMNLLQGGLGDQIERTMADHFLKAQARTLQKN